MTKTERQAVGHEQYIPSPAIRQSLARTVLVQLIGPTAVGKSTLIDTIISKDPSRFSEVGTLTTRPQRESDSHWVTAGIDHNEMEQKIAHRELVQYFHHPGGDIYATDVSRYRTDVCLLPTMAEGADDFLRCGFKKIVRIGIIADGRQWERRLEHRKSDHNFYDRMIEAKQSLQWMNAYRRNNSQDNISRPDLMIVENDDGRAEEAADKIIDTLNDNPPCKDRPRFNTRYLEMSGYINSILRDRE